MQFRKKEFEEKLSMINISFCCLYENEWMGKHVSFIKGKGKYCKIKIKAQHHSL